MDAAGRSSVMPEKKAMVFYKSLRTWNYRDWKPDQVENGYSIDVWQ